MNNQDFVRSLPHYAPLSAPARLRQIHLDPLLLVTLLAIIGFGLLVLYSAVDRSMALFGNQVTRMCIAVAAMLLAAQFHPRFYLRWTPVLYAGGLIMLVLVLLIGDVANGSQR